MVDALANVAVNASSAGAVGKGMFDRVSGVYRNRLCKAKDFPKGDVDTARLTALVASLFDRVDKSPSPAASLVLGSGILFLTKVLQHADAPQPVKAKEAGRKRRKEESEPAKSEVRDCVVLVLMTDDCGSLVQWMQMRWCSDSVLPMKSTHTRHTHTSTQTFSANSFFGTVIIVCTIEHEF